jgi:hypothetical protein
MAGTFSATGNTRAMGRVNRALFNQAVGTANITLRAKLGSYYGFGASANIRLSGTFAGRNYPFTY